MQINAKDKTQNHNQIKHAHCKPKPKSKSKQNQAVAQNQSSIHITLETRNSIQLLFYITEIGLKYERGRGRLVALRSRSLFLLYTHKDTRMFLFVLY